MPATTPLFGFPYPLGSESPNGPAQIGALAQEVEDVFGSNATARTTIGVLQHAAGNTTVLNGSFVPLPDTPVTNPFPVPARLHMVTNVRLAMGGGSAGVYAPAEVLLIINDTSGALQVRQPLWVPIRSQEDAQALGDVFLDVPAGATRRVSVTVVKRTSVTGTLSGAAYSSFSGKPGLNWTQVCWT